MRAARKAKTAAPATTRSHLEAAIERAIETLDALDGEVDLEPSLGTLNPDMHACTTRDQARSQGCADDREHEDEREPDDDCEAWTQPSALEPSDAPPRVARPLQQPSICFTKEQGQ